jgi:hypothetical protein
MLEGVTVPETVEETVPPRARAPGVRGVAAVAEGKVNCDTFVVSGGRRIVTVEFERERVGVRRLLWSKIMEPDRERCDPLVPVVPARGRVNCGDGGARPLPT